MPRSGDAIAQRIDTASDAPARKQTSRALAALVGAVLAIAGAVIVHRHGYAGHALIAIGAVFFLLAPQWRTAESEVAVPSVVSRTSIAGLLLLTLATGTSIFSLSDRAVVVSWLAGCVALIGGVVVSRLRFAPPLDARARRRTLAIVLLVVVAAAVNFYRLADFPPAVHGDVGEIALAALDMDVFHDLFRTTSWWHLPGMHHALQRLGFAFADGLRGARATDAAFGVAAVVPLVMIVEEAAGLLAAMVTGVLAIGAANLINTWRLGVGLGPPPFLALAALWAFLRGMRTVHSPRDFFLLAGVFAGLSVQVNLSARVVPLALGCFAAHELVFGTESGRRRMRAGFLWTTACALLVAGPLLCHYARSPELLQPRADKFVLSEPMLQISEQIYHTPSPLVVVWQQALRSFGMFHFFREGENVGFFVRDGGFFEPLTAAFFVLGLVTGARRFRERQFGWPVVGWILSVLLVAATIYAPSYHRAGPAAAFALVIAGLGVGALLCAVGRVAETVHLRGRVAVVVTATLIAVSSFVIGIRTYFFDYCRREWTVTDSTEVARRIAAEPAAGAFTYLMAAPRFNLNYGNIRFLARGRQGEDLLPGGSPPTVRDLRPGVNLFIALPHRVAELKALAATLPPGSWEEHWKKAPSGQLEFLVLRIDVPERADSP